MGSVHVSTVHELGRLVDACAVSQCVLCAARLAEAVNLSKTNLIIIQASNT